MPYMRIVKEEQSRWPIIEVGYGMFWVSSKRSTKVEKKGKG
jgi:hypothetical protein